MLFVWMVTTRAALTNIFVGTVLAPAILAYAFIRTANKLPLQIIYKGRCTGAASRSRHYRASGAAPAVLCRRSESRRVEVSRCGRREQRKIRLLMAPKNNRLSVSNTENQRLRFV
jgi:hypothetical protein